MSETLKQRSRHLRGQIVEDLSLDRPGFIKETVQILKFCRIYQQTDRDQRKSGVPVQFGSMVSGGNSGRRADRRAVLANQRPLPPIDR
jgi:hypothetical protein